MIISIYLIQELAIPGVAITGLIMEIMLIINLRGEMSCPVKS
jgi:hypothetical protein